MRWPQVQTWQQVSAAYADVKLEETPEEAPTFKKTLSDVKLANKEKALVGLCQMQISDMYILMAYSVILGLVAEE